MAKYIIQAPNQDVAYIQVRNSTVEYKHGSISYDDVVAKQNPSIFISAPGTTVSVEVTTDGPAKLTEVPAPENLVEAPKPKLEEVIESPVKVITKVTGKKKTKK